MVTTSEMETMIIMKAGGSKAPNAFLPPRYTAKPPEILQEDES